MDFSSQYPFPAGQPYQSFMTVPPLTPSNSHSAGSDDFNTTSPPEIFDGIASADQFQGFEYNQGFHNPSQHQSSGFPGPPTPPNPAKFASQQPASQIHHQPPSANGQLNCTMSASRSDGADDSNHTRVGSDEDDSLTPAQSRRKAQNRAAQRAFRERKEKHVKDLEAKLAHMEAVQQQASVENERLKRDLQKVSTENEILRATSSVSSGQNVSHSPEPTTTGPMNYNPTDFYSNVLQNHQNKFPSHRIVTSDEGERLLAAGATWDFIINHDLYKRGLVDVGDVSERLKSCARCDGQGPVFSEHAIVYAMEQSVASGSDDLL
ncbi:bZIP transcription factor (Fcr3) [Metarhizium rileyi]|uniref:BZIP transcription factor (Fcr3) n=1 Tax=Metarhizium rileyi (strain RCEF 4871) TaxID=1649241 RepID=A0A167DQ22_METRR|nr:bZIP transcription factor (Fcr3) [Metarhizium rileyi RCEF 4871]TWU77060.1 hypothetical protein ED733_007916 [Metarhizium rileyi]